MRVLGHLSDIRNWALSAKPWQQEELSVAEEITQDQASRYAGELNKELEGHVWIDVKEIANSPEPTTLIHVRITN